MIATVKTEIDVTFLTLALTTTNRLTASVTWSVQIFVTHKIVLWSILSIKGISRKEPLRPEREHKNLKVK